VQSRRTLQISTRDNAIRSAQASRARMARLLVAPVPTVCPYERTTTVNSGAVQPSRPPQREGICAVQRHAIHPSAVASQAESASSILVTRSRICPQVSGLGVVCCLVQFGSTCAHRRTRRPRSRGCGPGVRVGRSGCGVRRSGAGRIARPCRAFRRPGSARSRDGRSWQRPGPGRRLSGRCRTSRPPERGCAVPVRALASCAHPRCAELPPVQDRALRSAKRSVGPLISVSNGASRARWHPPGHAFDRGNSHAGPGGQRPSRKDRRKHSRGRHSTGADLSRARITCEVENGTRPGPCLGHV